MQVRLRVEDGGEGGDLLRWLRNDPVAAHAQLSVLPAEPGQSEMGVADVVQAVLDDPAGFGSLAVAVAAWRDARRQGRDRATAPTVKIQYRDTTVEITHDDPAEIRRIVDTLTASGDDTVDEGASGS
ncbi:hypothetical protein ABZ826_24395 [Streptomyces sp. NPDC047515]|uniref:effector-associated constant component EACC1 n=1 Tax=Streptomyces sp. NPDC047515 TaxID=3155380 RepID=UPI0033ED7355